MNFVGELPTNVFGLNAQEVRVGRLHWGEAETVANDADGLAAAETTSTTAATTVDEFLNEMPCCRNLTFTPSGTMKADSTIVINGFDIANNAITETITLTASSAAVNSLKCFKKVTSVVIGAQTSAITFNIGWGSKLGLPYKMVADIRVLATYYNNVLEVPAATIARDANDLAKNGATLNTSLAGKVVDVYFLI